MPVKRAPASLRQRGLSPPGSRRPGVRFRTAGCARLEPGPGCAHTLGGARGWGKWRAALGAGASTIAWAGALLAS